MSKAYMTWNELKLEAERKRKLRRLALVLIIIGASLVIIYTVGYTLVKG